MEFSIISDLVGVRAGAPSIKLPEGMLHEDSQNVHYWRNAVRRLPGRLPAAAGVRIPDNNPILHYHRHDASNGSLYLFAYTSAHAYLWNDTTGAWDLMFTTSGTVSRWSTADFGQYVVSTDNLDKVQVWNDATPAVAFANLGGANGITYTTSGGAKYLTKAKVVFRHWNYLHLMNTTEDGTAYPFIDRWCSAGDLTDWDESHPAGGDANFRELGPSDEIVGAGIYDVQGANQLITFTQHTVNASWLVTDDLVYESHDILNSIGGAAMEAIVNGPDGQLYYLSVDKDDVHEIRRVYDPNPLSYDVQYLLDQMKVSNSPTAAATYVGQFREMWWAIPYGAGLPDLVLIYSFQTGTWQPSADMGITAFGSYTVQQFRAAEAVGQMAQGPRAVLPLQIGVSVDLAADSSGYTWHLGRGLTDRAAAFTALLVLSTDLGLFNTVKRLHGAWLYFLAYNWGTTRTVAVSTRAEGAAAYTSQGNVTISDAAAGGSVFRVWLPLEVRARHLEVKLSATDYLDFLGVIFDFDVIGERD